MRRLTTLFLRIRLRRTMADAGIEEDVEEVTEKQTRRPRDWAAIFLTAIRFLQLAYFGFAYSTLHGFRKSSYFKDDGPWQHSPDQVQHSNRMMRWVKMQASLTLIYHAAVLVVPCLLRLVRATRRPFAGLVTVFGDGCAMIALLNTLVMLDTAHEGYCHGPPPKGEFDLREVFNFGHGHHHGMSSRRTVCRSMDALFGLGGLIILSHLVTAIVTTRRAKRLSPTVSAKVEPAGDVEQGIPRRSIQQELAAPVTPLRRHSPPPPYHPIVSELAQDQPSYAEQPLPASTPRGRSSTETTSSLGLERYGYLVSDGWRAPEGPPEYSSRPPSLHHAVV